MRLWTPQDLLDNGMLNKYCEDDEFIMYDFVGCLVTIGIKVLVDEIWWSKDSEEWVLNFMNGGEGSADGYEILVYQYVMEPPEKPE